MATYTTRRAWAITADGRAVPDDHPEARQMVCGAGSEMPLEDAERYGIVAAEAADVQQAAAEADPKAESAPPATKQVHPEQVENKAQGKR